MNRARPFHPCQVETGATYVVDSRSNKVISTITYSFDQVERWHIAKRRADRMNDAHQTAFYRRRRFLAFLVLLAFVGGVILALLHR